MHVLFLAPETARYNQRFVDALQRSGARVSGVGHAAKERLPKELASQLAGYRQAKSVLDADEVLKHARELAKEAAFDRVETIDEPVIASAARVREVLGLPGVTPAQAKLCRDKAAMKSALRERGIPVAASAAAASAKEVHDFVEREGLPVVVKPLEGFGTLDTYRCSTREELERALKKLALTADRRAVVEEYVEGHEGFLDSIVAGGRVAHDFVGHYYPTCLEALQDRRIAPKITCTNRMGSSGYEELRAAGQRVIDAIGLTDTATHLEWFFGPKGLKISEIGARPAGERIWDMHAAGNDFDLYGSWAEAVLRGQATGTPSRRLATGSVQIRPDREGRYMGHDGVEEVRRALGDAIFESEVPARGDPVLALDKGWHVNTWFRVRDEDYDRLRERLDWIGRTVRARAV